MSTPEAADSEEAKAAAGTEAADEEGKEEELFVLTSLLFCLNGSSLRVVVNLPGSS